QRPGDSPAALTAVMAAPALVRWTVLAGAARTVPATGALAPSVVPAAAPSAPCATAGLDRDGEGGDPLDRRIDPTVLAGPGALRDRWPALLVNEEVDQLLPDDHVLPQRHRADLGDHDLGVAADLLQPGPELLRVGGGGREGDQLDGGAEMGDDLLPDDHVLPQRPRADLGDHDLGVAAGLLQPGPELLRVGDGGREGDQLDGGVEMDDDLLPDRAAHPVGEVVDLIHHDEAQRMQQ